MHRIHSLGLHWAVDMNPVGRVIDYRLVEGLSGITGYSLKHELAVPVSLNSDAHDVIVRIWCTTLDIGYQTGWTGALASSVEANAPVKKPVYESSVGLVQARGPAKPPPIDHPKPHERMRST